MRNTVVVSRTEKNRAESRYAFGKPYAGDLEHGLNLGYTGKPYDPTTGLYNYGYRDYQPQAARFTTVDPVRDGANWFAYVNNDPINMIDPLGLFSWDKVGYLALKLIGPIIDPDHKMRPLYDPRGFKYFDKYQMQRLGGYDNYYEQVLRESPIDGFVDIDSLKTTFTNSAGKEVEIWLWKGNYNLSLDGGWHTGGEIGAYYTNTGSFGPSAANDNLIKSASFTLTDADNNTYNRPGAYNSYWINGFWKGKTAAPSALVMQSSITFHNEFDAHAYAEALMRKRSNQFWGSDNRNNVDPDISPLRIIGNTVIVTYR